MPTITIYYHPHMLTNAQLAAIFADIADRLEIQGTENVFAIRAYRTASENIAAHGRAVVDLYREGGAPALHEIKGIGKEIAKKVESLVNTGALEFYDELKRTVPDGVTAMLQVPGVGPKRVREFWQTLGIDSVDALENAASAGRLRALPKMGEKAEQKILAGIASMRRTATGRLRIDQVMPIAEAVIAALRELPGVRSVEYAGSLRRGRDTIGDLDILVATTDPQPVMEAFRALPIAAEIVNAGDTKSTIRTRDGLQVDLRAIDPAVWGTALQYFTGSQMHNVKVREHAQKLGLSLNEYAVTDVRRDEKYQFDSEEALYAKLNMAWIPPELREDRGEVEAALDLGPHRVVAPDLIRLTDMRGDLQMHTTWSDGQLDVMGMARIAAGSRVGFTQSLFQVGGQAGSAVGPLLAAAIVVPAGQQSLVWFSGVVLLAMLLLAWVGRWYATLGPKPSIGAVGGLGGGARLAPGVALAIAVLFMLMFSKSAYTASLSSYYTFYLIDRFQVTVQASQVLLFVFLISQVAGALIGGYLGDRLGRRAIIWISILGALPFTLLLPWVGLTETIVLTMVIGAIMAILYRVTRGNADAERIDRLKAELIESAKK